QMWIIKSAQTHHRPGGLRRSARATSLENRVVVGIATLTPSPIQLLHALEPVTAPQEPRLIHVDVERPQSAQDLPGAVNVIDAPSAIPRPILLLVFANEIERLLDLRILDTVILVAKEFKNAGRNIGAFRIEHRVMVREWDLFQNALRAILVERR